MFEQSLGFAAGFLLFGLALILGAWALLRIVPRVRPGSREIQAQSFVKVNRHEDAVLLIQSGGRVTYLNDLAREWFDVSPTDIPNLERMSRRVRPGDVFFELCAAEGQARFSVNGKLADAVSYAVPGAEPAILVSIRPVSGSGLKPETSPGSGAALQTVTHFGQAIAGTLNLQTTIETILTHIEHLTPADFLEIKVWDASLEQFSAYAFTGPSGSARAVQALAQTQFGDYQLFLEREKRELFLPNTRIPTLAHFDARGERLAPMGAYIGLPLLSGDTLVGLLEVGILPVNGFTEDDLNVLRLIAGQAATALRNALMYEAQEHWASQLLGLTQLSQAVSGLHDLQELFERLVNGLMALFNVHILGFLLYDEQRRVLQGQIPFLGLSEQFVVLYKAEVAASSPAETRIFSQEAIISADASTDPVWDELGLRNLAQAASIHDTTLAPLVSAGRFLGFLQLSNHKSGTGSLTADEKRLLDVVLNQTAAILDNALLVQQARRRNQRAEAMRRIASLVSSNASLDEILRFSMNEAAQLLGADFSAIFLLDEQEGLLKAHLPSVYGIQPQEAEDIARLTIKPAFFHLTVAGSQRPFISGHLSTDKRVLSMYGAFIERLQVESSLNVPLIAHGQGIGEMMFSAHAADFFNNADLQAAATIASQIAVAIDNASRHHQGFGPHTLAQTSDVMRVARELNSTTETRELLRILYNEVLRISGARCATVVFFDGGDLSVSSARYWLGHTPSPDFFARGQSALQTLAPVLFTEFSDSPPHENVSAAFVVPIVHQKDIFGLMELHSAQAEIFDEAVQESLRAISVQAAIALGNARRLHEQKRLAETMRRRGDTLMRLFETSRNLREENELAAAMQALAQGIQESTPFQTVLVSLTSPANGLLRRIAAAGLAQETFNTLQAHQQAWSSVSQMLRPEFALGGLYFIPFDQTPIAPADVQMVTVMKSAASAPNAWHPDDMLLMPLYGHDGALLGLISLDNPRDGMRPDQVTLEALDGFAMQASLVVRSGLQIEQLRENIVHLTQEVERQRNLVGFSQRSLPMMLHKDLEQTISISHLNQRGRHIRAGLQLTEAISRQVDSSTALLTLGQQMLASFDMTVALVARETSDGPRVVHILGNLPRGANPDAMFGQRNPLRSCLQSGETILSANVEEDENWHDTPFLTTIKAKSFIAVPVTINNHTVAAVLAVDSEPMPALSGDDRQVYFQISRQVSIILQNINLLSETRQRLEEVNLLLDFSRRLSNLDPNSIFQTLLESALKVVSAAHAGFVLQWNEQEEALQPRAAMNYLDDELILSIAYHPGEALPGRVYDEGRPRRVEEINFAADYNLPAEQLITYRKAVGERVPLSSMLVPIQTAERKLGILVLDNFNPSASFRPDDEAILLSLAQQVALSLENARLVQTTQERAGQLQALNAVASALSSSLQREELTASLLARLASVIAYDTAILWLRQGPRMVVAEARGFDDNENRKGLSVDVEDSALLNEMIRSGQAISVGDVRVDSRFPSLVEAVNLSWLGIPLISKNEVIGVIAVEKREANAYSAEQTQLASTFASQAAVALENANLFEESLRRAAELDERSQRLALLNQFSSALSTSLKAEQVLRLTVNQLLQAVNTDRALLIALERHEKSSLLAVLPEEAAGQPFLSRSLPVCGALEQLRESQTVYTLEDISSDIGFAPLREFLPHARSAMLLSVASSTSQYAIVLQTSQPRRFSPAEIELARTIGNQAAIALENADLYQSTLSTAERMQILNQVSAEISANLDTEQIYHAIHDSVTRLMPVDAFIVALLDEEHNDIDAAYVMDMGQRISGMRIAFGQGLSGQVIASGKPLITLDAADAEARGGVAVGDTGTPHSIIAVPMLSGAKVIGSLSAQSYQFNAYTEDDLQLLGTLANQAAIAIINGRLFSQTQQLAATLEQRVVERTAALAREQRNTETLLRILTEVSSSLDLDRALSRTLALLNDAIGAEQGTILLLHAEDGMLHYRAGYGYATETGEKISQPTNFKMKVGKGLAGWVVKHRQPVLVEDLYTDNRWVVSQNSSQQHRSAVIAPLMAGEDAIGAIMAFHRQAGFFSADALEMVKAIGSQVAVAINNAQLYQLIRDQAERLGVMFRKEQMEASRQIAILEAVADGVVVTDATNAISFVNNSAQQILGLSAEQILNQPIENFSGMFGKSSQAWIETVHSWAEDASPERAGETFAEQISLDNGRVILVHLAPVIWQKEFLGTVSIFRDITHEVEVDRLKSEFVATVSHELRTPMTSIRGYVDVLLMGAAGTVSDNQRHFLDIVKNNTERLNILVNDLLDISRIEAGRVTLSSTTVDLRELAEEVVADANRRAQEDGKTMTITLQAPETLPRISGDPERLRQVIDNLVDNAYNYTPVNGQITVKLSRENGSLRVDVQDNGVGIPLESQERVFDRFYRGEDPLVLATPGTGLGLPIVKQLVEMHHGKIWLTSSGIPGQGSTFSFTLPLEKHE